MALRHALLVAAVLLSASASAGADQLVADVQEALDRLGYDVGTPDGVPGSRTERAIEAFQAEFGYPQDGLATPALLERLDAAIDQGAASPERLLKRAGVLRSYTRAVQEALAARGYDPGGIDGALGPQTRSAIRAYQLDTGLDADGEVSRELLAHLLGLG